MDETVQHYNTVGKIGEGGMGAVFKVIHQTLDRPAAIKRLALALATEARDNVTVVAVRLAC